MLKDDIQKLQEKMAEIKSFTFDVLKIDKDRMPYKDEDIDEYALNRIEEISIKILRDFQMNLFDATYIGAIIHEFPDLNSNMISLLIYDTKDIFPSFYSLVFYHCLIDIYDKLQYILFSNNYDTSTYSIAKLYSVSGQDYLLRNEYVEIDTKDNKVSIKQTWKRSDDEAFFRRGNNKNDSAVKKAINNFRKVTTSTDEKETVKRYYNDKFDKIFTCGENGNFNYYYLPLIQQFLGRQREYKKYICVFDKQKRRDKTQDYISAMSEIYSNPLKGARADEDRMSCVDKIYYFYRLEKLTSFRTVEDIVNMLYYYSSKSSKERFSEERLLSIVSIIKLPNIFSRILYADAVFRLDSLDWNKVPGFDPHWEPFNNNISVKAKQKDLFDLLDTQIKFLSEFYFPLIESLAFTFFYDWCRSQLKNNKKPLSVILLMFDYVRAILSEEWIHTELYKYLDEVSLKYSEILNTENKDYKYTDLYLDCYTQVIGAQADLIEESINNRESYAFNEDFSFQGIDYFVNLLKKYDNSITIEELSEPDQIYGSRYLKMYNDLEMGKWTIGRYQHNDLEDPDTESLPQITKERYEELLRILPEKYSDQPEELKKWIRVVEYMYNNGKAQR